MTAELLCGNCDHPKAHHAHGIFECNDGCGCEHFTAKRWTVDELREAVSANRVFGTEYVPEHVHVDGCPGCEAWKAIAEGGYMVGPGQMVCRSVSFGYDPDRGFVGGFELGGERVDPTGGDGD